MTTTAIAPSAKTPAVQSKRIRIIHRDSFGTSDRGESWGWSCNATWWHQVRGSKGFHRRILFGLWSKTEYPEPPTVDDIAAIYNGTSSHEWEVAA